MIYLIQNLSINYNKDNINNPTYMFCSDFLEAPTLKREHKKGCSIWHIKFTILNFIRYWSLSTLDFKILKWLFALKFFINREKKRLFLVFKGIMVYQIQNAECSFAGKMFHILNLNQSCTPQYSLNDGRILYTMEVHLTRKTNWILYKTNSGQKKKKEKEKYSYWLLNNSDENSSTSGANFQLRILVANTGYQCTENIGWEEKKNYLNTWLGNKPKPENRSKIIAAASNCSISSNHQTRKYISQNTGKWIA